VTDDLLTPSSPPPVILRTLDGELLDAIDAQTYTDPFHAQRPGSPLVVLVTPYPEGDGWSVAVPRLPGDPRGSQVLGHVVRDGDFFRPTRSLGMSDGFSSQTWLAYALATLLERS
jgi:hypothetical protein